MREQSWVAALLIVFGWQAALAAAPPAMDESEKADLAVDAEAYAHHYGVEPAEARRRLALQAEIGALDAALAAAAPETFAGLWIEHDPKFQVVVRFTDLDAGAREVRGRLYAVQRTRVELKPARFSLRELDLALEETAADLRAEGIAADLHVDVRNNRVEARVLDVQGATKALSFAGRALRDNVAFVQTSELVRPDMLVQGGRPITDFVAGTGCTSAFIVRSSGGQLGVTTAGHCDNQQTNLDDGTTLTFRAEDFEGNQDVQWHSGGCGVEFRNEFDSGTGIRNVTGSLGRSGQAVGAWVCKHGRTTGATCGSIGSKSFCPSYVPIGKSTFVCVNPGNVPLSQPGDSGGPWFSGNTAYGVHSGGDGSGTLAIYMPIDYISSLGLTVLNYNAGTNPPSATVTCSGGYSGSQNISCYASGYAGNPPYTFTGWSYYGSSPASSWSWSGSSVYAYYSSGCAPNSYQSFSVTVVDSCGRVGYGQSWFLCQPF